MGMLRKFFDRRLRASDEGFTVIEVLAALTVFAIVTAGAVPLFVTGLRASLASKFETQAKNLAQERLESMRNLPFYVVSSTSSATPGCWSDPERTNPLDPATNTVQCDYKDLLDTFYRSAVTQGTLNATTGTPTGGYVGNVAGRSSDEAEAGLAAPYYRYVLDPVPDFEQGRFSQVVLSQFLDESRIPVVPAITYNTQNSNTDFPPSRLLGVTIITRWKVGSLSKTYVTFSQIAEGSSEPTVVTVTSEATALTLRSGVDFANTTHVEALAGISKAQATLAGSASTSTYAQGGYAALVPGQRMDGAYKTASTPPFSTSSGGSSGVSLLANVLGDPSGAQYQAALLRETRTSNVTVSTSSTEPAVPFSAPGTSFSTGSLSAEDTPLLPDLVFNNGATRQLTDTSNGGMYALHPLENLAWVRGSGPQNAADGGTSVKTSSASGTHSAESQARASAQKVHLLPTVFAPDGLVRIQLSQARLNCKSPSPQVTGTFSGIVEYFRSTPLGGEYVSVPFSNLTGGASLPSPSSIQVSTLPSHLLSDYISSWTILSAPTVTTGSGESANAVSGSLDGIVRVTTKNTRIGQGGAPDDASAVQLRVGILSCSAEDKRT